MEYFNTSELPCVLPFFIFSSKVTILYVTLTLCVRAGELQLRGTKTTLRNIRATVSPTELISSCQAPDLRKDMQQKHARSCGGGIQTATASKRENVTETLFPVGHNENITVSEAALDSSWFYRFILSRCTYSSSVILEILLN